MLGAEESAHNSATPNFTAHGRKKSRKSFPSRQQLNTLALQLREFFGWRHETREYGI